MKTQRTKLQQALTNYKTQNDFGNDLTEPENLVSLYCRLVFCALPIPEQLTQYERVLNTTETKIEYCKNQAAHFKKL